MNMNKRLRALIALCMMIILLTSSLFMVLADNEYNGEKTNLNITIEENNQKIQEINKEQEELHSNADIIRWAIQEKENELQDLGSKWLTLEEKKKALLSDNSLIWGRLSEIYALEQAEEVRIKQEEEAKRKEEEKWASKTAQYPVATQVWRLLKSYGYNDYVCAGILGNMMTEVGGQTLNLRWDIKGNGYYGLCQWNKAYTSRVWGASVEGQCAFLHNSMPSEFKGRYDFSTFCNLTSASEAALVFARTYERCGSASYSIRQKNAITAYNFFVN